MPTAKYWLRLHRNRALNKPLILLGKRGALVEAFREIAKAIQWWYEGPGRNMHCTTGPDQYSDTKPFCNAGPDCVRCRQAVIARASVTHQRNIKLNFGEDMFIGRWYTGPRVKLNPKFME